MVATYLFRIDMAKDNDEFFVVRKPAATTAYAGRTVSVGVHGWIPDFVEVEVSEPPPRCILRLIELESSKSAALVSCRKYLPEKSADILAAFRTYLDAVIRDCRSSADPRAAIFEELTTAIQGGRGLTVTTAGALRKSAKFVEEWALLDQPRLDAPSVDDPRRGRAPVDTSPEERFEKSRRAKETSFHGILRLSQGEARSLSRCIMLLDAVIRGEDHSDAAFGGWRTHRRSQLMESLVTEGDNPQPELRKFICFPMDRGLVLDFEKLLAELAEFWSHSRYSMLDKDNIRAIVSGYYTKCTVVKKLDRMADVFESTRKHLYDVNAVFRA